jgi:hypothetical protein
VRTGGVVFETSVAASSDGYARALELADAHAPGRFFADTRSTARTGAWPSPTIRRRLAWGSTMAIMVPSGGSLKPADLQEKSPWVRGPRPWGQQWTRLPVRSTAEASTAATGHGLRPRVRWRRPGGPRTRRWPARAVPRRGCFAGATLAPGAARLLAGPTYATRRQLPAWAAGTHCSWKVEANPSAH